MDPGFLLCAMVGSVIYFDVQIVLDLISVIPLTGCYALLMSIIVYTVFFISEK